MVAEITFKGILLKKLIGKGLDYLVSQISNNNTLNDRFKQAVTSTNKKLEKQFPSAFGGDFNFIFKNELVLEELVLLLFKNSKIDESKLESLLDIQTLPNDFLKTYIKELRKELLKDIELNSILTNKEAYITFVGLDSNVRSISSNSDLTLKEIKKIRELLEKKIESNFSVNQFKKVYFKNALQILSQLNFLGLGVDISIKRNTKKIEDLFVKPSFTLVSADDETLNWLDNEDVVSYEEIFDNNKNLVILGNPGSGKSVLIKSIICSILRKEKKSIHNQDVFERIPFRVELRKYLTFKKKNNSNLLLYIRSLIESEYGVNNITKETLSNIFSNYNCILFFDGLDEIFKIKDKIEIRNDIENFHNSYENIVSLTTSRIIGYEEAKLNPETFVELNISHFNDNQIVEYLKKWYSQEEKNNEIKKKEINGFIERKDEIDRELITNPLLLSLIVILYRNTLKLPESKLEIYQSCTKTLVDKWDASKELEIDLEPEIYKNKEKILANLAHWQYEELSSETIHVTYENAKRQVSNTLVNKLAIANEHNCFDLAERFMAYAQKRSIYFDNNFTHKTFLEYYAAYWLYSNIEKKNRTSDRNEIITKYISNSFWHIVLELFLNMIDKDQADNEIMDSLISTQLIIPENSLAFLISTVGSFKNVSRSIYHRSLSQGIEYLIEMPNVQNFIKTEIFDAIRRVSKDDVNTRKLIVELCLYHNQTSLKYTLIHELYTIIFFKTSLQLGYDIFDHPTYLEEIKKDPYLFRLDRFSSTETNYFKDTLKFIELFGANEMFVKYNSKFDNFHISPFIESYLSSQIFEDSENLDSNLDLLENLGLNVSKIIQDTPIGGPYFSYQLESFEKTLDILEAPISTRAEILILWFIAEAAERFNITEQEDSTIRNLLLSHQKSNEISSLLEIHTKERRKLLIEKLTLI